ncbi:MAG: hypothetical protein ACREKS_04535 [Candidatus Rokuibacteriota bacterium]
MNGRLEGIGLSSIAEINVLPAGVRDEIYLRLVPDRLLAAVSLDRQALLGCEQHGPVRITAPDGAAWVRIELWAKPDDRDPTLLLDVGMSGFAVPELSLVQINDPYAPRFAIDRDGDGQDTLLGTACRNEVEECRALAAGLAPGQVRRGLRMLGAVLESMDEFCRLLGREFYLLEPLFYHSAILYERRSCGYFIGRERMEEIHAGFQAGGELHRRLDSSSPFRGPGLERTARGRSWAIHDGILGEPWQGVKMFRAPQALSRISTFPGGPY